MKQNNAVCSYGWNTPVECAGKEALARGQCLKPSYAATLISASRAADRQIGLVISSPEELGKHYTHHSGTRTITQAGMVTTRWSSLGKKPNLKYSQVHKLAFLRWQAQEVLRQWKLLVGVGGTGFGQSWEDTHPSCQH